MDHQPQFLSWSEVFEAGIARCGGKGLNLARLQRYGFDVPAGGVLTIEGYAQILNAIHAADTLRTLRDVSAEETGDPAAAAALDSLRAGIESAKLPPETAAALEVFLYGLGCTSVPMAVRSSATAEDGSRASFAGMHRSYLNVVGAVNIAQAILGCYASLWTPRALAYRRRMGIKDDDISCAVVLCAMVAQPGGRQPVCSGVAFTCDPATGRRDLIVINSVRGSGEALVGGTVQPEQVIVRREKRGMFFPDSGSDVTEPVLGLDQALQLARLALRVHWALGEGQDPQDIEWAFDGVRFWLLQARPVTALPTCTFAAVKDQPVTWSTANIKEAIPGVISTLSWSLILDVIADVLNGAAIAAGYNIPPGLEVVRRFDGRGYFDLTGMQWCLYDALGVLPRETVNAIGGQQPEISVPPGNPLRGREGLRRFLARLRLAKRLWRLNRELDAEIQITFQKTRELISGDLKTIPTTGLLKILREIADLFDAIGFRAGLANAGAGSGLELLRSQLLEITGDRCRATMNRLIAGSGNITSAEQGYRILDLIAAAHKDESARNWLSAGKPGADLEDLPADSPFRKELLRFLDDFGHRAVYEADLLNPRWNEDPSYILDQVRHGLTAGDQPSPAARVRALRMQAEGAIHQMPAWRRPIIRWLVKRAQQGMALREAAKSAMGATVPASRQVMLEIGRRLSLAGNLDQASDIFHLSYFEVQCYLHDGWDGRGARALAADRKAQREHWITLSPPDVIVTGPNVTSRQDVAYHSRNASQTRWPGIGVSPGQAQGVCRIVRHPLEGERLKQGDILVAPSTDPGWTPLFLRAAGIVMETGGYLSHGAIVAREYGIPAVVNIPCFLEEVRDGAGLFIDGDNGIVEIMD
jgi:phosphohistidine swiveling domain-containing protein